MHVADASNNAVSGLKTENGRITIAATSPIFDLLTSITSTIHSNIEHSEPRVRSLIGRTVGAYALLTTGLVIRLADGNASESVCMSDELTHKVEGLQPLRKEVHDAILKSLKFHFEMKRAEVVPAKDSPGNVGNEANSEQHKLSKASDGALDDTSGWRALETNLHALAGYIDGCCVSPPAPTDIYPGSYLKEQSQLFNESNWFLQGLEYCSVTHVNRHVRAASSAVLGVLVSTCMKCHSHEMLLDSPLRDVIKESLKANLADNWSQVRMAGSVLCRKFVVALLSIREENANGEEEEDLTMFESSVGEMVPMLLPRMCLNRFYLAQGVKLYSQDTWKMIFGSNEKHESLIEGEEKEDEGLHSSESCRGGGGMGAVARNAAPLCRYYSRMCDADNHAVREVGKYLVICFV